MAVSKESTIFPVGTIFVDRGNYRTGDSVVLFYQWCAARSEPCGTCKSPRT